MAEVVFVGLAVGHVGFAHDKDVVAATEGVGVECHWAKVDIGVVARSLVGGGAVEVPFGKIFDGFDLFAQSL